MPKAPAPVLADHLDVPEPVLIDEADLLLDHRNPRFYGEEGANDQDSTPRRPRRRSWARAAAHA